MLIEFLEKETSCLNVRISDFEIYGKNNRDNYKAKKQGTAELLVKVTTQQEATNLLNQTLIADLGIVVTPHRSLNSSQA